MRTLADLNLNTLTIPPTETISSAMVTMQRAGVNAVAISNSGELQGVLTIEAAVLSEPDLPVKDVMRGSSSKLDIHDSVRQAAKTFVQQQADYFAVFDGKKYVGLLSSLLLISELGRSWDPLTGLSWSDRLRDWGVECLESGQEIAIVFFDLNDFGAYNKKFGHTVGDAVIKGFAQLLNKIINPGKDILVRYGGDEFAIGTTRTRSELEALLQPLNDRIYQIDVIKSPVSFSYGVSGGKRTHEPSRDHVAATLDNLINLASKACLASKPKSKSINEKALEVSRNKELTKTVSIDHNSREVTVKLMAGDEIGVGRIIANGSIIKAVAEATAKAIYAIEPNEELLIEEAIFVKGKKGKKVYLIGEKNSQQGKLPFTAEGDVGTDPEDSVAKAIIEAWMSSKN